MLKTMKERLDTLLVERELVQSRQMAQALIIAGEVTVDEMVITKPGTRVNVDAAVRLRQKPPFVSRGGIKLAHALDELKIDPNHKIALDIGASTGGFTDCMLKRGASMVYAVDVGYGQLDYGLRGNPKVIAMERVNARHPFELPQMVDLITIDISFISLEKVLPNVVKWLKPEGSLICLVKPQFEAEKAYVSKGGLIKDPSVHAHVLGKFISWSIKKGFRLRGLTPSPILGATGNREFFVLLRAQ